MEGYLYVNEDELGLPSDSFTRRFFILFPFCGLRWYLKEPPADLSYNKLLQHDRKDDSHLESGWVYGGNIRVDSVLIEKEFSLLGHDGLTIRDTHSLMYPFVVKLRCGADTTHIRFASESETLRLNWIRELNGAESMQTYLLACKDKSSVPSRRVFSSIRNVKDRIGVHYENMHLTSNILECIINYINRSAPNGLMLHSLRLENVLLTDAQGPLIGAILTITPHLTTLSLAENSLTDIAITESIVPVLAGMAELLELDLSNNCVGDAGAEGIAKALQGARGLEKLDISRNKITARSVRILALHLCGHHSKLKFLNLSHNCLGNGAAAVASMLMGVKPAHLKEVDLSCTGLTEIGLKELIRAIPSCESLKDLKLKDMAIEPEIMTGLVQAVAAHQTAFATMELGHGGGRVETGLSLHLGGLVLDACAPRCLSYRSLKSALPFVHDKSRLRSAVLRRRILTAPNVADDANKLTLEPNDVIPLCRIRAQLPLHIYSIQELIESLAHCLGAHPQQLRLVSATPIESHSRCCEIILSIEEAGPRVLSALAARAVVPIYTARLPAERISRKLQQGTSCNTLPTAKKLKSMLKKQAKESSPLFLKLGIKSIAMQDVPQPETPNKVSMFAAEISRSGGRRIRPTDEHIPIIAPDCVDYYSMNNIVKADDGDEEQAQLEQLMIEQGDHVHISVHHDYNAYGRYGHDEHGKKRKGTIAEELQMARDLDKLKFDTEALLSQERSKRRTISQQLVKAIRMLKREGAIDTPAALFWEGALGNAKCRSHATDALKESLSDKGIFHAVWRWNELCEAMAVRDTSAMATNMMHIKNEKYDGGTALLLSSRLLSEIISLQRDAHALDTMAPSPQSISFVESYLLQCGRLGYSGPEMIAAVEHRKKLIFWAAEEHPELIQDQLDFIRQKAFISNLMISRNFAQLKEELSTLTSSKSKNKEKSAQMKELPEVAAAMKLLSDYYAALAALKEGIKTRRIPRLEKALAEAAYLGIDGQEALYRKATEVLVDLCSIPVKLLRPIIAALRDRNLTRVEDALQVAISMGWRIKALDSKIPPLILEKVNDIAAKDEALDKLVNIARSIRNGIKVPPGEVLQLLRRADGYGLHEEEKAQEKVYWDDLSKYVKKHSAVLQQERDIQNMIDDVDIAGLQLLLSGRGQGTMVVSCPSEALRDDWLEMFQAAAVGAIDDEPIGETQMLMAGTLDKAARSEEPPHVLRGWRERYFVLQGTTLSYYTTRHGDRKGRARILGGSSRALIPDEADGRQNAIEIQEGRDLSNIDSDLLLEAKKLVDGHLANSIHDELKRGILFEDLHLLEEGIAKVEGGVVCDFELVKRARANAKRLKDRALKLRLRDAAFTVPRGQMEELVRLATENLMDPANALLSNLVYIANSPDIFQGVLRLRGAMATNDDPGFRRALNALARYESKRFSSREMGIVISVIIQHAGLRGVRANLEGDDSYGGRVLKQALTTCRYFVVETEPMQIASLLINLVNGIGSEDNNDVVFSKSLSLDTYLDEAHVDSMLTSPNYALEKYEHLRTLEEPPATLMSKASTLFAGKIKPPPVGSTPSTQSLLRFYKHEDSISKTLLNYSKNKGNKALCLCAFTVLRGVMGDVKEKDIEILFSKIGEAMKTAENNRKERISFPATKKSKDVAAIMECLLKIGSSTDLNHLKLDAQMKKDSDAFNIADEMYVQLCKQLTDHPVPVRRLRGWLLMSAYLHYFHPIAKLVPFLKNFIAHAVATEQAMMPESAARVKKAQQSGEGDTNKFDDIHKLSGQDQEKWAKKISDAEWAEKAEVHKRMAIHDDVETRASIIRLARYCLKLLSGTLAPSPLQWIQNERANGYKLTNQICASVISRAPLSFQVILTTGSEYTFTTRFGDNDTPSSIWPILFGRLVAGNGELRHITETYHLNKRNSPTALAEWIAKQFRGFALYEVDPSADVSTLLDIPVQPDESTFCKWNSDMQWDLLVKRVKVLSGELAIEDAEIGDPTNIDTLIGKKFILRRRVSSSTESFAGQLELFSDQVADNDLVTLRGMWADWLTNDKQPLPCDHVRIDLLFAEECRYVNSRMYHTSDECFYFLLGIQLALSWEDADSETWGEPPDAVLSNVDLSVRPSYRQAFHFKTKSHHSSITHADDHSASSSRKRRSSSRMSSYFKLTTMYEGSDAHRRMTLRNTSSHAFYGDTFSKTRSVESGSTRGDAENDDVISDDASVFEDTTDSDIDSSDSSDSADTSDSEGEKERKRAVILQQEKKSGKRVGGRKGPFSSYADVYDSEKREIMEKLISLGIDPNHPKFDLSKPIEWMIKFQQITDNEDAPVSTGSPQFRYLMKRAYLHYLATWPLYGYNFTDSVLLQKEGEGRRDVLVGVGMKGLTLLDPEEWTTVMHVALSDVTCVKFFEAEEAAEDEPDDADSNDDDRGNPEDSDSDHNSSNSETRVNSRKPPKKSSQATDSDSEDEDDHPSSEDDDDELESSYSSPPSSKLPIKGQSSVSTSVRSKSSLGANQTSAHEHDKLIQEDRKALLRECRLEISIAGHNAAGAEETCMFHLIGRNASSQRVLLEASCREMLGRGVFVHGTEGGNDLLERWQTVVPASDYKEIFRCFTRDFSILPIPPTPEPTGMAPDFFQVPLNSYRRKLQEREREEENNRQNAAKSAAQLQQAFRNDKKDFQNELQSDDEEGETESKSKSDLGGEADGMDEDLSPAGRTIYGVPRPLTRVIPPAPTRTHGKLRIDLPLVRTDAPPPMAPLPVSHPHALPPIGIAAGGPVIPGSISAPVSFPSPPRNAPGSPTIPAMVRLVGSMAVDQPAWSAFQTGYVVRSNLALEEIVECEDLIADTTAQTQEYFYVGHTTKRRKKKNTKKAF